MGLDMDMTLTRSRVVAVVFQLPTARRTVSPRVRQGCPRGTRHVSMKSGGSRRVHRKPRPVHEHVGSTFGYACSVFRAPCGWAWCRLECFVKRRVKVVVQTSLDQVGRVRLDAYVRRLVVVGLAGSRKRAASRGEQGGEERRRGQHTVADTAKYRDERGL